MAERILLMAGPGGGKTTQIINVANYLLDLNKRMFVIDFESKFRETIKSQGDIPKNMKLYTCTSWSEFNDAANSIINDDKIKRGEWIGLDRIDLSWPFAQRDYSEFKYKIELSERLEKSAQNMKGGKMFVPRFDAGDWQVVNEKYDGMFSKLIYKTRANTILTSGVKTDDSPVEMFGNLGVVPRGQKELGHQPISVFLLEVKKEGAGKKAELVYQITTAKDLKNRARFEQETLIDFALQYVAQYYDPNNPD